MINGVKSNKKKCWILHLGWSNAGHKGEKWLEISLAERDLGVLVDSQEGKQYPGVHQTQYDQLVKRGGLSHCIHCWPHLEYRAQFWTLQFQKDV